MQAVTAKDRPLQRTPPIPRPGQRAKCLVPSSSSLKCLGRGCVPTFPTGAMVAWPLYMWWPGVGGLVLGRLGDGVSPPAMQGVGLVLLPFAVLQSTTRPLCAAALQALPAFPLAAPAWDPAPPAGPSDPPAMAAVVAPPAWLHSAGVGSLPLMCTHLRTVRACLLNPWGADQPLSAAQIVGCVQAAQTCISRLHRLLVSAPRESPHWLRAASGPSRGAAPSRAANSCSAPRRPRRQPRCPAKA